jgi:uncharacterized protein (TIGR00266 family)
MSDNGWYLLENNKPVGPMSLANLITRLPSAAGMETLVYGPGITQWTPARQVPSIAGSNGSAGGPPPAPSSRSSHDISYKINGSEMQYVEVELDPGETVIAEPGAMMYMDGAIRMETRFGDPSRSQGFMDKLMTAGRRVLTGESMFMTTFANDGSGRRVVAFAAPYPGKILPLHLDELGGEMICQKDSFLAAAMGVQISVAFQKRMGVALFGGEGFIMQRLKGDGIVLIHAGGTLMERTLNAGETIKLDTGCLVALQPTVNYDIQFVGGFKNTLFGGEGLFLATLTGPGKIWLQSLPFSRLAGRVLANAGGGKSKDEGSVLGGLGLGSILGGDD